MKRVDGQLAESSQPFSEHQAGRQCINVACVFCWSKQIRFPSSVPQYPAWAIPVAFAGIVMLTGMDHT